MKALILAAGLGTRLRPHTQKIPKCLFPIAGRPILDIIISRLVAAGCEDIMINTHHLNDVIENYLSTRDYPVLVRTRHEPELLGTGGALKNLADFWDQSPFFIINGDVICDIDLAKMYAFHQGHKHPVTLCLVDSPEFNIVSVDPNGFIKGFTLPAGSGSFQDITYKTLSGIHVADPVVLDFIPSGRFSTSIDAYTKMLAQGYSIKAYQPDPVYWNDIGSPKRYQQAVYDKMAPDAFKAAFSHYQNGPIEKTRIKGDGSDRTWFRLKSGPYSLILANHGIAPVKGKSEAEAFALIGSHLYRKNLPVPKIYLYDIFSGLVFVEDLGDVDLETFISRTPGSDLRKVYQPLICRLVELSVAGKRDFDLSWTYQTACYDVFMVLEKECRYFVDSFLNGYLNMRVDYKILEKEFIRLAELAIQPEVFGFMHRDFQHRNIMVKNGRYYFIDFQGGRIGPVTYDLASLLIDPYVDMPEDLAPELVKFCYQEYAKHNSIDEAEFISSYNACALTRNLQILGAFSFLTRNKAKPQFAKYIPAALATLEKNLSKVQKTDFSGLLDIVQTIRL